MLPVLNYAGRLLSVMNLKPTSSPVAWNKRTRRLKVTLSNVALENFFRYRARLSKFSMGYIYTPSVTTRNEDHDVL